MEFPIYFDYAASTPVDPRVMEKMLTYLRLEDRQYANPTSASHRLAWEVQIAIEEARSQLADLIQANPQELIWTSGATESDNLAIKGTAYFNQHKGKHIVTAQTEHSAVLETCRALEREGFDVTYLKPESNGLIELSKIIEAIRPDTILVSIMQANNEIGMIQDIQSIGEACRERGVLFHVDAAQSLGKLDINCNNMAVDLMSFSGHKIYGPKGIGALYMLRDPAVQITALFHGGGQEHGLRSGTLATHQIVAMGEACRITQKEMHEENKRILRMRNKLWHALQDIDEVYLNGDLNQRIPGNLNLSVAHVEGEELLIAMNQLAMSAGSACASKQSGSHVLHAIGRNAALSISALRISMGRFTTDEEVDFAAEYIRDNIHECRKNSSVQTHNNEMS